MCIRDSPQGRWRVVDIYLDASHLGIYPPLFTSPSWNSCILFSESRVASHVWCNGELKCCHGKGQTRISSCKYTKTKITVGKNTVTANGNRGRNLVNSIPAHFFWDIGMRFLFWECWDFWRWHDHFRRFSKKSEVFQRRPKTSKDLDLEGVFLQNLHTVTKAATVLAFPSPNLNNYDGYKCELTPSAFHFKDQRSWGRYCHLFILHAWFSFLTWVWVCMFLEIVSRKTATTHIFSIRCEKLAGKHELARDWSF